MTFGRWLDEIAPETELSIYLHVPFCKAMCHYCGCHTKVARKQEPVQRYLDALIAEIDLLALHTRARVIRHIHWGGGTPSMLGVAGLEAVYERVATHFDVSGIREHAIELDPRLIDRDLAASLARIGVTRTSLGVQDFDEDVQRAIGRIQPISLVRRVVANLRDQGITSLNLDLMYGLPKQTAASIKRTAIFAAALEPDRLAVFGYAHVPWMKKHQRLIDESALPGAAERMAQAGVIRDSLRQAGYQAIGIDHFARTSDALAVAARMGTLKRNFQGYTTDDAPALIGLGASAISQLPQGYAQNAPDIGGYERSVGGGALATVRGVALNEDDRFRAAIIERLMCDFAVDVDGLAARFGHNPDELGSSFATLLQLQDNGLLTVDGHTVRMTPEGQPFVRLAAAAFDAYVAGGKGRHSSAV